MFVYYYLLLFLRFLRLFHVYYEGSLYYVLGKQRVSTSSNGNVFYWLKIRESHLVILTEKSNTARRFSIMSGGALLLHVHTYASLHPSLKSRRLFNEKKRARERAFRIKFKWISFKCGTYNGNPQHISNVHDNDLKTKTQHKKNTSLESDVE